MPAKIRKFCIAALFAICLLSAGNVALASPICPVPTEVTQPDGTVITVTAYGDEFFSWREDENGNVIAYDEETDSYKYAEIEDGKLVPTSEMVGKPSLSRRASKRLQREDIMPLWENAERIDYFQPSNSDITLMSADEEPEQEKPLTHRKLLTLLIEFNDVKLKYDGAFWAKQMYSTNPRDISVVNYWKENANGLDIFEPAETSNVQDGASGTASYKDFTNIGYTITKCPEGVIKVSLDMPHPSKTWNDQLGQVVCDTAILAFRTVENYFDFPEDKLHLITVFAGYNVPYGDGEGQINAFASGDVSTSDGIYVSRCVVQSELQYDDIPAGIGITCHELGHAVFYLPDLYFSTWPNGGYASNGLAAYSLMSLGGWGHLYNRGNPSIHNIWDDPYAHKMNHVPAHLDPWCKIRCGFVTPTVVNEWDGNIDSISAMGIDSPYEVLEIRSKADANQYFLMENRQLIGYDSGLELLDDNFPGNDRFNGGIVIYHVDGGVFFNNNNNNEYHRFISVERSNNGAPGTSSASDWAYINRDGRNKFGPDTEPNSNLHQIKTPENGSCTRWTDCHPQTLKSGISIEVLGVNGPSMRVKANVDEEYRVSMVEDATFIDLFPDANFRRAVMDNMKEKDGMTRTAENVLTIRDWATLSSIDDLQISGYGIKDLTGIELFPILDWLNCSHNEITELTPEQVPNLIFLDCKNNKLTELDLTQWGNLMYLWCENNQLTELDTSQNGVLWDFNCSNNQITALDLSGNVELGYLECQNNKLTSLDFTNNPHLEYLWCFENYMDSETPENSIRGLEPILPEIGLPSSKDNPDTWFVYYPQNIPGAEHNWESAWQKDDTHHWHNCADTDCPIVNNADKGGYGEHTWDSGNVTKQPTCSAAGIKTFTCTICEATKREEIAVTGHTVVTDPEKAPTCTESGLTVGSHCSVCGAVLVEQETVPATGHIAGEWEIVTPATTKQEGLRVKKCTACHAELEREPIPKRKPAFPSPSIPSSVEPDPSDDDPINCSKDENCPLAKFSDTSMSVWYHDGIHYCIENGLMNGKGNGKFAPGDILTRGMLAQILYSNAGRPAVAEGAAFTDVAPNAWYAKAVAWAAEKEIVTGYSDGRFGPNDPITRQQLAAILWRYAGSPESMHSLDSFRDGGEASAYAIPALEWAVEQGIVNGKGGGILAPTGKAARAEAAAMLMRYCEIGKK